MAPYTVNSAATSEHNGTLKVLRWFKKGVLTVGSLVPKEGRHTLPHNTLLVIPPWCRKPPFFVGSPRSLH